MKLRIKLKRSGEDRYSNELDVDLPDSVWNQSEDMPALEMVEHLCSDMERAIKENFGPILQFKVAGTAVAYCLKQDFVGAYLER